jgi:hypothetical protein
MGLPKKIPVPYFNSILKMWQASDRKAIKCTREAGT